MKADQFKKQRVDRGLDQKQWAAILGVSYSSVTKWERGLGSPIPSYVEKLVSSLNVSTFKLTGLSEAQLRKLNQKLADTGETVDDYVSRLLRNILVIGVLFVAVKVPFLNEHSKVAAASGVTHG